MTPHQREVANLANELVERAMDEELFTLVLHPEVAPTNNQLERLLRGPAKSRDTGRTDKNYGGARRRSIIMSIFES